MALELKPFLSGIQTPVKKLTISELREREELWRVLWSWLDEDVKKLLLMVGSTVRVMQRNYTGKVGELGEVRFEPKTIEVVVYEKTYNYNDGKYYYERKVVKYPFAAILWVEDLLEQRLAEEVEDFSLESIEEEVV